MLPCLVIHFSNVRRIKGRFHTLYDHRRLTLFPLLFKSSVTCFTGSAFTEHHTRRPKILVFTSLWLVGWLVSQDLQSTFLAWHDQILIHLLFVSVTVVYDHIDPCLHDCSENDGWRGRGVSHMNIFTTSIMLQTLQTCLQSSTCCCRRTASVSLELGLSSTQSSTAFYVSLDATTRKIQR